MLKGSDYLNGSAQPEYLTKVLSLLLKPLFSGSALQALRTLQLDGFAADVIDFSTIALNINFKGKLMYEREDMVLLVGFWKEGEFVVATDQCDSEFGNHYSESGNHFSSP